MMMKLNKKSLRSPIRILWFLSILLSVISLVIFKSLNSREIPQIHGNSTQAISFEGGFENAVFQHPNTVNNWHDAQPGDLYPANADRLTRVSNPVRKGNYSLKVVVKPGDSYGSSGERAEVYWMYGPDGKHILENETSGTRFYAISVYLPTDFISPYNSLHPNQDSVWGIFQQLHGIDIYHAPPPFAIGATNTYYVQMYSGDLDYLNDPKKAHTVKYSLGNLQRGKWVDFVWKIKFAKTFTGSVDVWKRVDGEQSFTQVLSIANIPTLQFKTSVNGGAVMDSYWKTGYYTSQEKFTRVIYIDSNTRGDSFDAVVAAAFPTVATNCTPTNGGWSAWSSCSGNIQKRTCTNPSPTCGGNACVGNDSQCCNGSILCNGTCITPACGSNASCNDSNACTTDVCSNPGTCGAVCTHKALSCDDGNTCTADSCNNATGCIHTNSPINGEWTYGPWENCSVSCGGGTQTRTATCNKATCGGTCSGTPITTQTCNVQSCQNNSSIIKVYAAGTPANGIYPTMQLIINDVVVKEWNNISASPYTRPYGEYTYTAPAKISASQVKVKFINDMYTSDFNDRNLIVGKINIDGIDYQSESSTVYSTGTWTQENGCLPGYKKSEWLHCTGYFKY